MELYVASQVAYLGTAYGYSRSRLEWSRPYISHALDDPQISVVCAVIGAVGWYALVVLEARREEGGGGGFSRELRTCAAHATGIGIVSVSLCRCSQHPRAHYAAACLAFGACILECALVAWSDARRRRVVGWMVLLAAIASVAAVVQSQRGHSPVVGMAFGLGEVGMVGLATVCLA
jgi:hypothetical protein